MEKNTFKEALDLTLGAVTYGAEKLSGFAKDAYSSCRKVWDKHEKERAAVREKLLSCKEKFLDAMRDRTGKTPDFDAIVNSIETLTEEELQKLKEILSRIG